MHNKSKTCYPSLDLKLIKKEIDLKGKLTCKSNSRDGHIVSKDDRVRICSVMRGSTNGEDPWTERRHALR